MKIYEVKHTETTKKDDFLKYCTEAIFLETLDGIYVEQPGNGFFKHPILATKEQLIQHLDNLKTEGFGIKETTITCRG